MGENDWYFILWLGPRCSRESSDFDVDLLLVWGGLFLTCCCFRYPAKRKRWCWKMAAVVGALATSPADIVASCWSASLVWRRWGQQVCIKSWIFLFLTSLFLATDGTCGPISWLVGVIVAVAILVVCFCSFAVFCCARHVRRRRGLLDDC